MNVTLKDGIFVAMDSDGVTWAYTDKPRIGHNFNCWNLTKGTATGINTSFFNTIDLGPWNQSLHVVKDGKLIKYVELPDLAVDTPVWVRYSGHTDWTKRHFAYWGEDGKMWCWNRGCTSFTQQNGTFWWPEYSLTDPTNKEA